MKLNEANFELNCTGVASGERYVGKFKTKLRLSHRDMLRKDASRRELLTNATGNPEPGVAAIAELLSTIWVHLIEEPKWFTDSNRGLDLLDEEPIIEIFQHIMRLKNESSESSKKEAEQAKEQLSKP